jgi:hypothetical protein
VTLESDSPVAGTKNRMAQSMWKVTRKILGR